MDFESLSIGSLVCLTLLADHVIHCHRLHLLKTVRLRRQIESAQLRIDGFHKAFVPYNQNVHVSKLNVLTTYGCLNLLFISALVWNLMLATNTNRILNKQDLVGAVRDPKGMWRMPQKKFKIGSAGILAHAAVAGVKKISYKSLESELGLRIRH